MELILSMTPEERAELKAKLRGKIEDKSLSRSNKKHREKVIDEGMEKMGIDRKKLQESINIIQKSGGKLSFNIEQ